MQNEHFVFSFSKIHSFTTRNPGCDLIFKSHPGIPIRAVQRSPQNLVSSLTFGKIEVFVEIQSFYVWKLSENAKKRHFSGGACGGLKKEVFFIDFRSKSAFWHPHFSPPSGQIGGASPPILRRNKKHCWGPNRNTYSRSEVPTFRNLNFENTKL